MNDELRRKVQMARQQGIPDDVIRQRVQQQFGVDINEPVKQPSLFSGDLKSDRIFSSQGLLPSVVNALASPCLKWGRIIGGAGSGVGREQNPEKKISCRTLNLR